MAKKVRGKQKATRCWWQVLVWGLILLVMAVGLEWFLEFRQSGHDWNATWDLIGTQTKAFCYSALIVFFVLLGLTGLLGRPFVASGVVAGMIYGLTFAHLEKLAARGEPLLPSDFALAGEGAEFVSGWSVVGTVIAIILMTATGCVLEWLAARTVAWWKEWRFLNFRVTPKWKERQIWVARIGMVLVSIVGIFFATQPFTAPKETTLTRMDWLSMNFNALYPAKSYRENGFLLSFLYYGKTSDSTTSLNDTEETIAAIQNYYESVKANDDKNRTVLSEVDYNIVIVLCESFYDPELLRDYYNFTGEDVVPNLHAIQKEYPSGYMYTPGYGGGTGNIEFEVITGLTNYWLGGTPYTDYVVGSDGVPSVANWAKENAYSAALSVHSFTGEIYNRTEAMGLLGFDDFISMDRFHENNLEKESERAYYLNDRSAYNEVLMTLAENDDRQMILLTTMQNHVPYTDGVYQDHEYLFESIESTSERAKTEEYVQSIHNSDAYLGEFITNLESMDEKTVVLWFGDHAGGGFTDYAAIENQNTVDILHSVPYFIYTNFDLETGELTKNTDLPQVSPNCLINIFYDYLNVQKPALSYLVADVCQETPILEVAHYQISGIQPAETDLLQTYKLVNYDILQGGRYWLGGGQISPYATGESFDEVDAGEIRQILETTEQLAG